MSYLCKLFSSLKQCKGNSRISSFHNIVLQNFTRQQKSSILTASIFYHYGRSFRCRQLSLRFIHPRNCDRLHQFFISELYPWCGVYNKVDKPHVKLMKDETTKYGNYNNTSTTHKNVFNCREEDYFLRDIESSNDNWVMNF
jgi:hypothetical protein